MTAPRDDDGTKGAFFGRRVSELQLVAGGGADVPPDLVGVWKAELKEDQANHLTKAYLAIDAEGQNDVRKRWASTAKRSRAKFEIWIARSAGLPGYNDC